MRNGNGNAYWLIAGAGFGAAVGLLLAPQSGEKTRKAIRRNAERGRDFVQTESTRLVRDAGDLLERGTRAAIGFPQQLGAAVQAGKRAYRQAVAKA